MQGRQVILRAYGQPFEIQEYDVPDPGPGDIVLRITQAGICGSDLHTWRDDTENNPVPPQGRAMGHEGTGVVYKLGHGMTTDALGNPLHEGDRVIHTTILDFLVRNRHKLPFHTLVSHTFKLDDVHEAFAQAEWNQRQTPVTRAEVLVNCSLLLLAGHETTINLLCNGTLAFIRHPEQWALLKQDPAGWAKRATEECLRYDAPVKSIQRIASQDVEMRGKVLRQDDRIRWFISSANRDPEVFAHPETFDITRDPNPHVAFGSGVHHCLGATLARLEGQEAFKALAERFPSLHVETEELAYQPSMTFRSLTSLPVAWD